MSSALPREALRAMSAIGLVAACLELLLLLTLVLYACAAHGLLSPSAVFAKALALREERHWRRLGLAPPPAEILARPAHDTAGRCAAAVALAAAWVIVLAATCLVVAVLEASE